MPELHRLTCTRCRRGDSGLSSLEWLLITAAVASLAALAVVLVQAEVQDTAQRLADPSPRVTAAIHSAFEVEIDARAASGADFVSWSDWERRFSERCRLIEVLYSDADVEVVHNDFRRASGGGSAFDPAGAAAADEQPPQTGKAQTRCEVR